MRLIFGITSALVLVLAQYKVVVAAANNVNDVIKIPITPLLRAKSPSTVGRWEHTLRKYGLSTDFGPTSARKGPQGRQRGRVVGGEIAGKGGENEDRVARVPLVDFDFDREYYGTVLVGEPPQSFKIDFDTGSSRFILSSKGCLECSGTTRYDPALSTTFHLNSDDITSPSNTPTNSSTTLAGTGAGTTANPYSHSSKQSSSDSNAWHITYGDMSHAEGFLGRDHVTLGVSEVDAQGQGQNGEGRRGGLTVQHQELALVTSESANFDDAIDGIMGLAFGALSSPSPNNHSGARTTTPPKLQTQTVFENMMSQGLVDKGLFSFYLGKTSHGGGGEVLFGGWDPSRIVEGHELVFTNVTRPKYWQINVENVFVSDKRVEYTAVKTVTYLTPKTLPLPPSSANNNNQVEKRSNIAGIVDTGTTLVIAPFRLANAIHASIPRARISGQSWAVPCDLGKTHAMAKVELQIEGVRFSIPFDDLVREPVERPIGPTTTDSSNSLSTPSDNNSPSDRKSDEEEKDDIGTGDAGVKKPSSSTSGSRYCFSGIQPSGANFMIIGDVFIKNNYVVFDQENQRVGIAPLKLADPLPLSSGSKVAFSIVANDADSDKKAEKMKDRKKKKSKEEDDDKKEKRGVRMRMGWEVVSPSGEGVFETED
ncbi:hypothetical protein EC991_002508 [Linnemannia zychae]|nr:hypothetical protein EC991_002508 [Linnemannia zychae]